MKPSRDDFPLPVKRLLAARVSHHCSRPECRAPTSGPQLDDDGVVNLGVAAHITAASPGGPRYDPSLTAEERADAVNGIWLCQNCGKLVDSDLQRFSSRTLQSWKAQAESAATAEVGKTSAKMDFDATEVEGNIMRRLKLRDTLQKALLKPPSERRHSVFAHPYDKFQHHKITIRSLTDRTYPASSESERISSWFRVELYDFYHNGLEVILNLGYVIVNDVGEWRPIGYKESFDQQRFRRIKAWTIGQIPYDFIRAYDLNGDEYLNEPHLYCAFENDGEPYESIRYSTVGESNTYDFPLDNSMRLPASSAV